jgi:dipeptidyl aminopeptidase/acylaminoacyl peptidase
MRIKRLILWFLLTLFLCGVFALGGISIWIYNSFTIVERECKLVSEDAASFTPAMFTQEGFDTTPYWMSHYETVQFASRDAEIMLSGFYIPADQENAPTVIIVHGYQSCKNAVNSLLPAGMLHRNGFNVMDIDLRNMGTSDIDNGHMAGGTKEYKDVLGAWDWLVTVKGIPPERIGLFGYSLGGASVLIAMGNEPLIEAAWTDSSYGSLRLIIDDLVKPIGLQGLVPIGLLVGRLVSGDDILSVQPLDVTPMLNSRPVYLVHGTSDLTVPYQQGVLLADALEEEGSLVEFWTVEGSQHVSSMFDYPQEYESRLTTFFKDVLTQ